MSRFYRNKRQYCCLCILGILAVILLSSTSLKQQQTIIDGAKKGSMSEIGLKNALLCHNSQQNLGLPDSIASSTCTNEDCAWMTCDNLLFRKIGKEKYKKCREWMNDNKRNNEITDFQYISLLNNCEKFKKERNYPKFPLSEEELEFPIAFNLIVHQDVEHVERLLRSIYFPQNIYCIHLDEKQSDLFKNAIRSLAKCFDNVFIPSETERIIYAGFSRLKADINCMQDLVKLPTTRWKYLINIAGQSMPLRSNLEMVRILKIYNGANDIEGMYKFRVIHGRLDKQWKEFDPLYHNVTGARISKTGKLNPPPPHDIDIVRGSAYGVFSRAFVQWLLTDKIAHDLLEWSRNTYSPDEHYWSTLHHTYSNPHIHPPGAYKGIPQEKPWLAVYVAWGGLAKCHGQWKRGICILGVEDLPSLVKRYEFFVNKFHIDYQYLGLDCLEMWIKHKNNCPESIDFNLDYYRKLPFIIPPS